MYRAVKILALTILLSIMCSAENWELLLSEADNSFDENRMEEAVSTYKKVLKLKPDCPEAWMQIGHVHLLRGYHDVAMMNFKKAVLYGSNFILPEKRMELYLNMAATYHRMRFYSNEMESLNQVIEAGGNSTELFYKEYAGKAHFLIALLDNREGRLMESRGHFLKAAEAGYRAKCSYLFLSHFYAVREQGEIDELVIDWYKKNPQLKYKTESRDLFVNYYKIMFEKTPSSGKDEDDFLSDPARQEILKEVQAYRYQGSGTQKIPEVIK